MALARNLTREVVLAGPVLGTGEAPGGTWELRALYDTPDAGSKPGLISMSRRGSRSSFCYAGQVVHTADRVQLRLTDDTTSEASLLGGDLPVLLWIAFSDGTAVPTEIRAFSGRGELGAISIDEDWPGPRTNTCWGRIDD